ncbi:MAG: putative toxin-antitoxin system toxin component, PIN family [Actinomycetota bacterium]|nr:putative toxin-antitoxin system toxin component, PIN family [Actinomycetota bacterium]
MADTNVLVAAAITPRGLCGRLLVAAIEGRWQLVASPALFAELDEVVHRAKFRRWFSPQEASCFVADLRVLADVVDDPVLPSTPQTGDPDDEFLVALASSTDVAALISGDPHPTDLVDLDPPVLSPAVFLDRLPA